MRRSVTFLGDQEPRSIVIDTQRKFLNLVQSDVTAMRYGIGFGKQGFSWFGDAVIRRKAKWPRWTPPAGMIERDPLAAK